MAPANTYHALGETFLAAMPSSSDNDRIVAVTVRDNQDIAPCYVHETLLVKHTEFYRGRSQFNKGSQEVDLIQKAEEKQQEYNKKLGELNLELDNVEQGHLTYVVQWLYEETLPDFSSGNSVAYWKDQRIILIRTYALADYLGIKGLIATLVNVCKSRYKQTLDVSWRADFLIDLRLIEGLPSLSEWPLRKVLVDFAVVFLLHDRRILTDPNWRSDHPELPLELIMQRSYLPPELFERFEAWFGQCQYVQNAQLRAGEYIAPENKLKSCLHPDPKSY